MATANRTERERRRPRTADGEDVHEFLVRLPRSLHEKLRNRAHEDRRTKADIIRDALTIFLK